MNIKRGFAQILVIIAVIVALILLGTAIYLFITRQTGSPTGYAVPSSYVAPVVDNTQTPVPAVQGAQDLTTVSNDLDKTNVDNMNSSLDQNTTDAASFAPRIRAKNGTSTNWAGYAVETNLANPQNNAVSDVKGSWTVPAVTCTSTNTYSAMWLGIDGYSDGTVEQTGTESDCSNGFPRYYSWYEMYPHFGYYTPVTVKAGDNIFAEVKYVGNNQFKLTLTNTTNGQSFSTTQKLRAQRSSAEWIVEAPWSGGVLPLANFGTTSFTGAQATLNGNIGSIATFANDPITMVNSSGGTKASVSGLGSGGDNFSVTWVASN